MSYRTQILEKDLASYSSINATEYGAFVIKAGRGTAKPRFIQDEISAINFLSKPSSTYPEVQEVIDFIKSGAPCWVSAPSYSDALYGGVAVKVDGIEALSAGIPDISILDFDEFPVRDLVDTGDGSTVTFTATLSNLPYVDQSIAKIIYVDSDGTETEYTVTASDDATETLTSSVLSSGTLVRATGALSLTFSTAPTSGYLIYVEYEYDCDDIRFILTPISPCASWLKLKLISKGSGSDGIYTFDLQQIDDNGNVSYVRRYEFSLTETKKDDAGKPVYIGKILDEDIYITYVLNSDYAGLYTAISSEGSYTTLASGKRGTAITATERNTGWAYFQKKNTYPADIIVETSGESSCVSTIYDLVTTYQKYKAFGIVTLPYGEASASALISILSGYSINSDQMAFYCNWGKVENPYIPGTFFWTPLVGRDAKNMAKMAPVYNSLAPAGSNDGEYGGELGTGIKELEFDFTDTELQQLDDARINPHVFDTKFGYMAGGDRTAITTNTDTSYIGTRRLLNLIIYNTVDDILRDQEFKFIDTYRKQLFEQKFAIMADPILRGDATHPNGFCSYLEGIADNDNVNTTASMQQRKFRCVIAFQATPNSQKVELEVIRLPQGDVQVNTII